MLKSKNGRTWSERSPEEAVALLREELDKLTPQEREVLQLIIKEMGDPAIRPVSEALEGGGPIGIYDAMREMEYKRAPVDIETFVKDDYYLGESCKTLYPKLLEDLKEIFSGGYREAILCLHPDTVIPLLNGTTMTIKELSETKANDKFWVYGVNDAGDVIPAQAELPQQTGEDDYYKVELDDGTSFICNSGHQMIMRDGNKKKVSDIKIGESLMPFYANLSKKGTRRGRPVASIQLVGWGPVYCMSVPSTTNFAICTRNNDGAFSRNGVFSSNSGSIGWGKTYCASIAICYVLYQLSCLQDIHRTLKLGKGSDVSIAGISVNEQLAIRVVFENITVKIAQSPYFKENFQFEETKKELRFPSNVQVVALSTTDTSALGLNVISILMDECLTYDSLVLLSDGKECKAGELFDIGQPFKVATFDFINNEMIVADAEIRQAATQECVEITTDNGVVLRTSWNHPIACLVNDKLVFKNADDIKQEDLIVTFVNEELKNGKPREKAKRVGVGREETFRGSQSKNGRCQEGKDKRASFRRDQEENRRWQSRQEGIRGVKGEDEQGRYRAWADSWVQYSSNYAWVGPSQFWQKSLSRNEEQAKICPPWDESFRGNQEENVGHQAWKADAYRRIQAEVNCIQSFEERKVQALSGNACSSFREERLAPKQRRLQIPWIRGDEVWQDGIPQLVGAQGDGANALRSDDQGDSIRETQSPLCIRWSEKEHCSGFYSDICNRREKGSGGEAEGLYEQPKGNSQEECRNRVLQGAKLGIYGLDRRLSLGRVTSKKQNGVQPTYDIHVPGREVFVADGALVHNTNFYEAIQRGKASQIKYGDRDKARVLYDQMTRRMKSRFLGKGKLPGLSCLVSSKRTKEDFISKRIAESVNDPLVYVMDYNLWTLVPERYGQERFQVLVGNDTLPSKIVSATELEPTKRKIADLNDDSLFIIDVPTEFESDFANDIDGSLKDIAGVDVVSISPFIQQRDRIELCIDKTRQHPFQVEEWDQSRPGSWIWEKLASQQMTRDGAEVIKQWLPIYYPDRPRHIHIDLSLNTDCTGICCGCNIGFKQIERTNLETREKYIEASPVIWVDFMLRIKPPIGGEIDHGEVRGLVYQLQSHGFHISLMTMDLVGMGSFMQKFQAKGITTDRLSVDRPMDPYDTLKSAIYESRVMMYKYEPILDELRKLQLDRIKNKVDHQRNSKKDLADALCGVVYSLTTRARSAPGLIMKGISQHIDPELESDTKALESNTSSEFFPRILF